MRIPTTALLTAALVAAVAACATPVHDPGSTGLSEATPQQAGLEALPSGDPLPVAQLPYLDREDTLDTGELGGQPAVVNFWATWCTFCVEEMPDFEEVHLELADEVRFIGVNVEDREDRARILAAETGVSYELVVDDDRSYYFAVLARGMPTTLFVDEDGRIAHRYAGPLDADDLRELIAEHLDVESG